jgi:exodeoxyribonuclease VII small subunit
MTPSAPAEITTLSYEAAFAELEAVVAALESEQRPLDESIALYERGQALMRHCATLLQQAELRVRQVNGDALTDFEAAEGA